MITVDIKWNKEDINTVVNNFRSIGMSIQSGSRKFLTEIAENIMAESKTECPIDTGTLKSSAYITAPMTAPNGSIVVKMGYGGLNDKLRTKPDKYTGKYKMASEYALAVHETKANYKVGKWKFLEDPLRRQARQFASVLVVKIRALIQKGGTLKGV